jgi:hypothetical protein
MARQARCQLPYLLDRWFESSIALLGGLHGRRLLEL